MILLIVFLYGLIAGSFVTALVWRLHDKRNWVSDRSECEACKHTLGAKDLVPLFSWLWLRGCCRYCKKPIGVQYPALELATGLTFGLSLLAWPYDLSSASDWLLFVLWLMILILLTALFVYDLKWQLLPNKMVATVTPMAVVFVGAQAFAHEGGKDLLMALLGGLLIAGLFWTLFQVSKGRWIGGGDVKLAFALGLLAGSPLNATLLVFVASLLGTIVALPLLVSKNKGLTSKVAFGPFLIVATIIVFLWGNQLIDWYLHSILYL